MDYENENSNFTLSATGDLLISRPLSLYTEPAYLELWEIIRSASIRFTNLETLFHEYEHYPSAESGGTPLQADPILIQEIKWAGFNLLARANNHALDYGIGGLLSTSRLLNEARLCHAGAGENLAAARSPAYLDMKEGRVALLSAASTFFPFARAGEQRQDMIGRPGINPVRYTFYYVLDRENFRKLREISEACGFEDIKKEFVALGWMLPDRSDVFNFVHTRFALGDTPGFYSEVYSPDLLDNIKWIQEARRQADFIVFSMHWHEIGRNRFEPAIFHPLFARACIDAGVNAFIGHGPHVLRGIEIYRNRPIFYSLGNFVFQNETVRKLPADAYEKSGLAPNATPADYFDIRSNNFSEDQYAWEGVVPWCRFENGKLVEARLYPITLGFGKPRTVRGRPMLAKGELAEEIIAHIAKLSLPFGTRIEYHQGIGRIIL